jgi:hypoxanthine phosphoribosyltransferase
MDKFKRKYPYTYFIRKVYHKNNTIEFENVEKNFKYKKERVKRTSRAFYENRIKTVAKPLYYQNEPILPFIIPVITWFDIHRHLGKLLKREIVENMNVIIGVETGGYFLAYFVQQWIWRNFGKKVELISCKTKRFQPNQTSILDKIEFPKNMEWTEMKEPIWIIDDVIRNGYTITKVIEECKNRGYEEIKTMTIFDSPYFRSDISMNEMYSDFVIKKQKEVFLRVFCAPWGFDT